MGGREGTGTACATPSELRQFKPHFYTQGFKANPGLEFANAFSVSRVSRVSLSQISEGFLGRATRTDRAPHELAEFLVRVISCDFVDRLLRSEKFYPRNHTK